MSNFNKENLILLSFILLKLAICLYPMEYGYFCDELYYIALSHHLSWGYVDVPPLLPFCLALLRYAIGNSLFAIHLFSAITGVVVAVLAWLMTKKMGGGLFAQFLALISVTLAPYYICQESLCDYDCLDKMFWALALYFVVVLFTSKKEKYWIYFGVAAGLGLMSKFDMLWLGTGVVTALLLTSQRKHFSSPYLWVGGIIALIIVSPYLIWNITHDYLTLEYFKTYGEYTYHTPILTWIAEHIVALNPLTFPIWGLGIYYFLFNSTGKKYRVLGIAYFIIFALCIILRTKYWLNMPYYVVLLAGGAVFFESLVSSKVVAKNFCTAYIVLTSIISAILIPYVRPVLPMPIFIKYAKFMNRILPEFRNEKNRKQLIIPHQFYYRFGWEETSTEVERVYKSLSEEERKNTLILTRSYGYASALDFYRGKYELPGVICGQLQYYLLIPQDLFEKTTIISIGFCIEELRRIFYNINQVGVIKADYAYENNQPVYLCKGFKIPTKDFKLRIRRIY